MYNAHASMCYPFYKYHYNLLISFVILPVHIKHPCKIFFLPPKFQPNLAAIECSIAFSYIIRKSNAIVSKFSNIRFEVADEVRKVVFRNCVMWTLCALDKEKIAGNLNFMFRSRTMMKFSDQNYSTEVTFYWLYWRWRGSF